MAGLTDKTIASTYNSLLRTLADGGITASLQIVEDGAGDDTCLQLSTKQFLIKSGTDIDATFDVQNSSSHQLFTIDTNSSPEEVVINEGGLTTIDFRVEGSSQANALFVDGTNGNVGIGTATPLAALEIEKSTGNFPALLIDDDDIDQNALQIVSENTGAVVVDIVADSLTTGYVFEVSADGLTSGNILRLDDNSPETDSRSTVLIMQNNVLAIGATALSVQSDGGQVGIFLDKNYFDPSGGNIMKGLYIDYDRTGAVETGTDTNIGIDLDVNVSGASGGADDAVVVTRGIDIDVVGDTPTGGHTVVGIDVDVGGATTKYAGVFYGGSVGIGIKTPTSLCHIKQAEDATTAAFNVLHVEDSHSTIDAGDVLVRLDFSGDSDVYTHLAKYISFHDGDNAEIGYIAAATDATSFNTAIIDVSDARLKTDIKDSSMEGLNIINALKVRDFKWGEKAAPVCKGKQAIGKWIADEVYEVFPLATIGTPGQMMDVKDENGKKTGEEVMNPMGIAVTQFIAPMMKAIQELSAKVEALENA